MSLGLPPDLFWTVTPREAGVVMAGAAARDRARADLSKGLTYTLAQLSGIAMRDPKRMPAYAKVFPDPDRGAGRTQTADAMVASLDAWAAMANGRMN